MPKHRVTQSALLAAKKKKGRGESNYSVAPSHTNGKLASPIHQPEGASCLIGHAPLKQRPTRSAERRPITSPHGAAIHRVLLVKHLYISLNHGTRNVAFRREPCEERFHPSAELQMSGLKAVRTNEQWQKCIQFYDVKLAKPSVKQS